MFAALVHACALCEVLSGFLSVSQDRRRAGSKSLGYLIIVWHDACSCATGGGSCGGGVFGPLGTAVPVGRLPKRAGRPIGPATLQCQILRDLVGFMSAFLFWLFCSVLWDGCWVFCVVFFCLCVWNYVWFGALQDLTPVCQIVCCPLFFSLAVWYVRRRRFSLFLSFSGAGKPIPLLGFGIPPCVSSSWPSTTPSIRTPSSAHTPKLCPAPVFFVFPSSFVFPVGMFLVRSGCVGFLGGWFFVGGF